MDPCHGADQRRGASPQSHVCRWYAFAAQAADEEHRRKVAAEISSYTVHSAMQDPASAAAEASTLPIFRGFERSYLQPLLLAPPLTSEWLQQATST